MYHANFLTIYTGITYNLNFEVGQLLLDFRIASWPGQDSFGEDCLVYFLFRIGEQVPIVMDRATYRHACEIVSKFPDLTGDPNYNGVLGILWAKYGITPRTSNMDNGAFWEARLQYKGETFSAHAATERVAVLRAIEQLCKAHPIPGTPILILGMTELSG